MSCAIVVTHRVFPETLALLGKVGKVQAPSGERFGEDELRNPLADAQAAMVFMPDRVDGAFLSSAPRLRIIAAALKGYDNIDVEACTARGIWLSIVPDLLTAPTAELTIGLIIGLARHLRAADGHVRSGSFSGWTPRFYGLSLEQSTVGVVGTGAVGRAVARRLHGFGCRLLFSDERLTHPEDLPPGIERRSFDNLLAASDIVVLCAPLDVNSVHMIDASRLARMNPHALLVNPARGSLVDEAAVADALWAGRLGGYAADAFELEDLSRPDRPRSITQRLLNHPNTLFGAHIGSATTLARKAIEARAAENIIDAIEGRRPRDAINHIEARS